MGIKGYIKLHRELMDWEWYKEPLITRLYVHLILSANHKDNTIRGISVKRGQFLTGRKKLSFDTGISEQTIRTSLNKLKSTSYLTIKSTSQHSIIALRDYDLFQRPTSELTNNQPASNQRLTTNKNEKKNKYISEFVKLWESYPNKKGRKEAERHFNASVKTDQNLLDITKALENFKKDLVSKKTDSKFIMHGSKWFNNWEDYINVVTETDPYDGLGKDLFLKRKAQVWADEQRSKDND